MNRFTVPSTALVLLASMGLSVAQAAPVLSSADAQVAAGYKQVDCIERDGGPSGCWSVGSNGGLKFMALDNEHVAAKKAVAQTEHKMKKSSGPSTAGMRHTTNTNANASKEAPNQEIPDRDSGVSE